MLQTKKVLSTIAAPAPSPLAAELARRLAGPQRHRLLQGYPALPLMPVQQGPAGPLTLDPSRGLIVGVLPHPFCNPQVRGCGFCTFPQQRFNARRAEAVADLVVEELQARAAASTGITGRVVDALYFGGATANLTPAPAFERLARALAATFDLTRAEVTLEGVPAYFLGKRAALLDALAALPARQRRLSMGVQSFDAAWRARMGRSAFGGPAEVGEVVRGAHARGWTTSCDLLVNLPGQPAEAMLADVDQAIDLGLDQVCIYHLVLHEGLGTEWSKDPALLAARPGNEAAFAAWSAVRARLLARGFVQATLTNFERADVHASERRFRYEDCSFRPERYDGLGFGPSAITTVAGPRPVKLINTTSAFEYELAASGAAVERAFLYEPEDLRLLHVTRTLPRLALARDVYRAAFGRDVVQDHADALEVLADAGLLEVEPTRVALTPRGMFHADTVAGLLAWRRSLVLRKRPGLLSDDRPWNQRESFMG